MQLICSNCGEQISAENINVQEMVAVCSACNNVFQFNISEPKPKRRKIHQPSNMTVHDDNGLHLAYRTNFRLDQNEAFLTSGIVSVIMTVMIAVMMSEYFAGDLPFTIPFLLGLATLIPYYFLGLVAFNITHIDMDEHEIQVSRQPLPNILNKPRKISLSGVVSIYSEETSVSKKEEYDTARYHVWAEMTDGSRRIVVNDVTEEYGMFIAQYLHEHLELDEGVDLSRLVDGKQSQDDDNIINDVIIASHTTNKNHNH